MREEEGRERERVRNQCKCVRRCVCDWINCRGWVGRILLLVELSRISSNLTIKMTVEMKWTRMMVTKITCNKTHC